MPESFILHDLPFCLFAFTRSKQIPFPVFEKEIHSFCRISAGRPVGFTAEKTAIPQRYRDLKCIFYGKQVAFRPEECIPIYKCYYTTFSEICQSINDFFLPISETYHSIIFSYIKIARKSKKALDRTGMMCYNNIRCLQHHEILAQLAEHTPFKRRVEGSNPSYLTKKSVSWFVIRIFCCMRQSYQKSACRIFMRLS